MRKTSLPYGKAIKILRSEAELTRKELAERAGISYSYLTEIESEKKKPSGETLYKIAQALGIRSSELFEILENIAEGMPITPLQTVKSEEIRYMCALPPQKTSFSKLVETSKKKEKIIKEIYRELNFLDEESLKILLKLIRKLNSSF